MSQKWIGRIVIFNYLQLFCFGIVAVRFTSALWPIWQLVLGILILLPFWRLIWVHTILSWLLGFSWATVFAHQLLVQSLPLELEKRDVIISGKVVGVPVVEFGSVRFRFKPDTLNWHNQAYRAPPLIRLRWYHVDEPPQPGEHWRMTVRLKQARGYINPGSRFDYETWLFEQRIRATGYVRSAHRLSTQRFAPIDDFRQRSAEFLTSVLPDRPVTALLAALSVGIKSQIDRRQWQVLQDTGTVHLMAISGLHIGLVSGLILLLASWLWRLPGVTTLWLPAAKFAILCALAGGLVYALLAGMTIPTRRALLMLVVIAIALLWQRKPTAYELLTLVLTAILVFDPLAPLAHGFWLSFVAVAIIIVVAKSNHFSRSNQSDSILIRGGQLLLRWARLQLWLSLAMAPILLLFFNQVSLISPFANLVAIPLIGFIVVPLILVAIALLALNLNTLAGGLIKLAAALLEPLWQLLQWMAEGSYVVFQVSDPPKWLLIMALGGVILMLAPARVPARWAGLFWLLPLFLYQPDRMPVNSFRYTLLEVGHGLASVIQTRHHTLVYDAGPAVWGGFDSGQAIVTPALQSQAIDQIDTLIISHGDNDHIGGHRALLDQFKVDRRLTSVPDQVKGSQACVAGQEWFWDGVHFSILWPTVDSILSGNNRSCVLKVESEAGSLLLTGDIERAAEHQLLVTQAKRLRADLLQVPHQGSKTSSTAAFLDAVSPTYAVVSTGYRNRYNHPHDEVAKRYRARDIILFDSAYTGAQSWFFKRNGVEFSSWREKQSKYWHVKVRANRYQQLPNIVTDPQRR